MDIDVDWSDEFAFPASITEADVKGANLTCLFTEADMKKWTDKKDYTWQKFVKRHVDGMQRARCPFCDLFSPRSSITRHLAMTLFGGGDGYRNNSRSDYSKIKGKFLITQNRAIASRISLPLT